MRQLRADSQETGLEPRRYFLRVEQVPGCGGFPIRGFFFGPSKGSGELTLSPATASLTIDQQAQSPAAHGQPEVDASVLILQLESNQPLTSVPSRHELVGKIVKCGVVALALVLAATVVAGWAVSPVAAFIVGLLGAFGLAVFAWLAFRCMHGPKLLARSFIALSFLASSTVMAAGYSGMHLEGEFGEDTFPRLAFASSPDYVVFCVGAALLATAMFLGWSILLKDADKRSEGIQG